MARSRWFRWLRIGFSVVALGYIAWALRHYWTAFASQPLEPHVRWSMVLASGGMVIATYGVLIQTWRIMLREWDARLTFWRAAHIWSVANLYRYVPGKVWQIGAMGMMAQREGISPIAATGSALLNTVVNITTGFAVALATGSVALDAYHPGASRAALVLTVLAFGGLLALPFAMPRVLTAARRLSGRDLPPASVPPRVIVYAIIGNLITWVMYGFAFQLLVIGVLGQAAGALPSYIAVYSASYVLGYIVLFLPAGIGARDGAMAAALPAFKLMTGPQAVLIAVSSRLWT
ncbi:MAG: lysylphosphatidylglycerol synthase domain-containing protein, partial [Gemmatimonadaceae bacterium]